jgi:hypothetical protein
LNNPQPTAKESRNSVQDVWLNELDITSVGKRITDANRRRPAVVID